MWLRVDGWVIGLGSGVGGIERRDGGSSQAEIGGRVGEGGVNGIKIEPEQSSSYVWFDSPLPSIPFSLRDGGRVVVKPIVGPGEGGVIREGYSRKKEVVWGRVEVGLRSDLREKKKNKALTFLTSPLSGKGGQHSRG